MKAQNIRELLEDIANLLLEHEQEHREDILYEELDRACIYTHNVWEILNEERPINFYNEVTGDYCETPYQLAYSILYEKFMDEYATLIY